MMDHTDYNLTFLLEAPDFSVRGKLIIEALAPLSMVTSMPGKYYRSQREPTSQMLYGLIENALGWHVSEKERKELAKRLRHKFGGEFDKSGVGFISLLQFHLRFSTSVIPPLLHYDDLWAQNLKGASFIGGSRNYDNRAIKVMNAYRAGEVGFGDLSEAKGYSKDPNKMSDFKQGENLNLS